LNSSGFMSGIQEAQSAFGGLGDVIKGSAIGKLAADAIEDAASGIVDFGKSALDTGMAFDQSMGNVAAISGATADEMDELRAKAKEMGATTKFTATEAADAFSYMAMAGWKTEDMLDGIEGIMNLAAASGENLATTSDIVTDALTAFGLSAEDSGHFADVLAAAASNANTNVGMMGETFKYVAPVAGALKYSAEDVAVAIGIMANNGVKAGMAGTALRAALSNLVNPTDNVVEALDDLGLRELADGAENFVADLTQLEDEMRAVDEKTEALAKAQAKYQEVVAKEGKSSNKAAEALKKVEKATYNLQKAEKKLQAGKDEQMREQYEYTTLLQNSDGSMKSFAETVETLRSAFAGLDEATQAEYASIIFGDRAMAGMLALINSSEEDYKALTDSIMSASDAMDGMGAAAEMAEKQLDNLPGSITLMNSAFDVVKTAIYERFSDPLKEAVDMATDLLSRFAQTLEGGGGLREAFGTIGSFIKEKFTEVWQSIELPPAVQNIADRFKEIFDKVRDVISGLNLGEKFSAAFEGIKGAFERARTTISEAVQRWNLPEVFSGVTEKVSEVFSGIGEKIRGAFDKVRDVIGRLNLSDSLSGISTNLQFEISALRSRIEGAFMTLYDSDLGQKVRSAFDGLREAVSGIDFAGIFSGITEKIGGVVGTIRDAIGNIDLSGALGGISEALAGFAGSIRPFIEEKFEKAAEIFGSIKTALGGLIGSLQNVQLPSLDQFADGVKKLFTAYNIVNETKISAAVTGIKGFLDAFRNLNIAGVISDIAKSTADLFVAFGNASVKVISSAATSVKEFLDGFRDSNALGAVIERVAGGASALFNDFLIASKETIDGVGEGVRLFLKGFDDYDVGVAAGEFAKAAADLFNAVATTSGDALKDVAGGVDALVNAGAGKVRSAGRGASALAVAFAELGSAISSGFAGAIEAVGNAFSGMGAKLGEIVGRFGPNIGRLGAALADFVSICTEFGTDVENVFAPVREWLTVFLVQALQAAVSMVIGLVGAIIDAITPIAEFFNATLHFAIDLFKGDWKSAWDDAKAAGKAFADFIEGLGDIIVRPFAAIVPQMKEIGANIIQGLWDGLKGMWDSVSGWFEDTVGGLVNGVKGLLGIGSPSKVFAEIGKFTVQGMEVGWRSEFGALENQVGRDVQRLTDTARIGFEDSAIGRSSAAGISSMFAASEGGGRGDPVSINLVLDGDVAATALYDPLRRTAFQRGQTSMEAAYA